VPERSVGLCVCANNTCHTMGLRKLDAKPPVSI
jgi:hypothetical protein